MGVGPTELIIIGAICCIPVIVVAVAAIIFAIVKFSAKDKTNNS